VDCDLERFRTKWGVGHRERCKGGSSTGSARFPAQPPGIKEPLPGGPCRPRSRRSRRISRGLEARRRQRSAPVSRRSARAVPRRRAMIYIMHVPPRPEQSSRRTAKNG